MGKMIDLLYRHQFVGRHELEKLITQIAKWKFRSEKPVQNVLKTVKFFKKLHIDLWMDIGGELYSFKELFGYDLRTPKSYHESFTRSITPEIQEKILDKTGYRALQKTVREDMKDGSSQVISADAFSRVSVKENSVGSIDAPQSIRGKVLSFPPTQSTVTEQPSNPPSGKKRKCPKRTCP